MPGWQCVVGGGLEGGWSAPGLGAEEVVAGVDAVWGVGWEGAARVAVEAVEVTRSVVGAALAAQVEPGGADGRWLARR